jgi:Immunity protein 50
MWLQFVENATAVTSVFAAPPSLEMIRVLSINLNQEGPTVRIALALNDYPSKPSPRWSRTANAVTLNLLMLGVDTVTLEGWCTDNIATIDIERQESGLLQITVKGSKLGLSVSCGWIQIDGLEPYHRVPMSGTDHEAPLNSAPFPS